jgi:predicted nucleic acid binding AN1-type Zn finger protein
MLMARCKKLVEENEQLGKIVSTDNVAKLEGEIALQNRLLSNIKDAQKGQQIISQITIISTFSLY